jgi:3-hydroxyacyl-CoA dehydrogenase
VTDSGHVAVVGAGVIGASWAALLLASGRSVAIYDVSLGTQERVNAKPESHIALNLAAKDLHVFDSDSGQALDRGGRLA